ncbi:MAG: PKD-like domain-containing protein, partial [Bacteroidota bacterium]
GGENGTTWMSGTRHHNNKDAWLALRIVNSNAYLSYRITASGINMTPVISQSIVSASWPSGQSGGWLKISQDGSTLVTCYIRDSLAEYCTFNDETGEVTPKFKFCPTYRGTKYIPEKIGFSVDNHFLYLHAFYPWGAVPGIPIQLLYQYDATKNDSVQFMMSESIVDSTFEPTYYEDLQFGPDNKIYSPLWSKDSVGIIHHPEIHGPGCNFQKNAIGFNGNNCFYGLPQFLQKYKAYLHYNGSGCQFDSLQFSCDVWPPADTIRWNFGDPASGGANISFLAAPSHSYSGPGIYTVELYIRHNDNRTDTTWRTITIFPSPAPSLGTDRTICAGNTATFDASFCSGCSYEWKNVGSGLVVGTNQTYATGSAGVYCVNVSNSDGCTGSDTVQLITTIIPAVNNDTLEKTICSGASTDILLTGNVPEVMFHWTATLTSGSISGFSADSGLTINQTLFNNAATSGAITYHITPKIGDCAGTPVNYVVTVNVGDSVDVSINASGNTVCFGTTVTFTATPVNPGSNPAYQWKVNGTDAGSNAPIFTYIPTNGDVVQCMLTSSNTVCTSNNPATSNSITMVVNPLQPVSVSISPSANPVCAGTPVNFTAIPINGGIMPQYQWKVNGLIAGTNSPIYSYVPANGDAITCTLNSNTLCPSGNPALSNSVTMAVNPALPAAIIISASSNPFCPGYSVTFMSTAINGGAMPMYQWKVNTILSIPSILPIFTYNPNNNDTVSCIMTSNLSCVT